MTSKGFTLEKVMRIYNDKEGTYIEVKQNPDFPDHGIVITTDTSKENREWYGVNNLCLNSKEEVELLAKALSEMALQLKQEI